MIAYIGTKSKQRQRRRIYYAVISIFILFFIYSAYIDNKEINSITNRNISNNDNIESKENSISLEDYEFKISEKDNQINSLIKKNNLLSESMDLLNFNLERNLEDFKEIANKEVEEANAKNQELQKELQNLKSSILEIKNDYKTISDEYLKMNLKLKKSEEKVLQSEKLLIEQNDIIEKLKGKIHH